VARRAPGAGARDAAAEANASDEPIEIAPGLVVERLRASLAPPVPVGDRRITIVRVDPSRYRLRLLTARSDGGARPLPAWVRDFGLTGAINASMYHPGGGSTGMLVRDGHIEVARDNPSFGGVLAFGPRSSGLPPMRALGRSCGGFDLPRLRADYRSLVQNYRLLDCDGAAIPWVDRKAYSAAAIGMDAEGHLVLVHSRTPYRMRTFARMLAEPRHRLHSLMFVEGGPEASLFVEAGGHAVREVGSYETGFREDDSNREFWELPNVLGFEPI